MSKDYTVFYSESYALDKIGTIPEYDVLISAYNETDRVRTVFDAVKASQKIWLIHAEYGFSDEIVELPGPVVVGVSGESEDDLIFRVLDLIPDIQHKVICIDISGFMRPHIMFILRSLLDRGITKVDVLYSEPQYYVHGSDTAFTIGPVDRVRPVKMFEGSHNPAADVKAELVIIAVGYEHELLSAVATTKRFAEKRQLLGLPPLQADFYQSNRVTAERAAEAIGPTAAAQPIFAPAADPFVAATVISELVEDSRSKGMENIYLCPISTRPHALGMAIYYLFEGEGTATSAIYPFALSYARDSARGIANVWRYEVEFPVTSGDVVS